MTVTVRAAAGRRGRSATSCAWPATSSSPAAAPERGRAVGVRAEPERELDDEDRLLPDLRVLTVAVARSIPGVASLAAITLLLVYVYGMIGWVVFREHDPENHANVGQAMVTMFVLLTLENLPDSIARARSCPSGRCCSTPPTRWSRRS